MRLPLLRSAASVARNSADFVNIFISHPNIQTAVGKEANTDAAMSLRDLQPMSLRDVAWRWFRASATAHNLCSYASGGRVCRNQNVGSTIFGNKSFTDLLLKEA